MRTPADKLQPTRSDGLNNINEGCTLYVPRGAKEKHRNIPGWNTFTHIQGTDTP